MSRSAESSTRFDGSYYARFYTGNAVHDADRIAHLATAVHELALWWLIPVRSVLDVGAGMGLWRDWYHRTHPEVRVTSVDVSAHACRTWGHQRRDIASWRPGRPYDLVICHSVLQYLPDDAAADAIDNLGAATRHLLYLEVPTTADFAHVVDPERTDMEVHARTGAWYANALAEHFGQVGAGLWRRHGTVAMFELEAALGT